MMIAENEKEYILKNFDWFVDAIKNDQLISFEQKITRDEITVTMKVHSL